MSSPASNLSKKVKTSSLSPPASELSKKAKKSADITAVKRSPLVRPRADCSWEGAAPYDTRGSAVKVTGTLSCGNGDDCQLQDQATVSFEATETFGISSSVGASFFDLIQASITFSYE